MPGVSHRGNPQEQLGRWLKRLDARVRSLESPYRLAKVGDYHDPTETCSSTSFVAITGMPSVSAVIGPEADCIITVGSFIGIPANCSAFIGVLVDGVQLLAAGTPNSAAGLSNSNIGGIAANVQSSRVFSSWFGESLDQGPHTFSLVFKTTSGTANFSSTFLSVEPL